MSWSISKENKQGNDLIGYGMVFGFMFFLSYSFIFIVMICFHFFISMFICVVMDIPKTITPVEYSPPKKCFFSLFYLIKCQSM